MANLGKYGGRTRVAVVDSDDDTRRYLKDVLQSGGYFTLLGEFSNAREALIALPRLRPNLGFLDVRLPDMDGIQFIRELRRLMPLLKIVILSEKRDKKSFDRAIAAGAVWYLVKPLDPDQLIVTLRFLSAEMPEPLDISPIKSLTKPTAILNPREKAVLNKLAEGLFYKEIPDALGISYTALRKCQHGLFAKLKVCNRSEAVNAWLQIRANC